MCVVIGLGDLGEVLGRGAALGLGGQEVGAKPVRVEVVAALLGAGGRRGDVEGAIDRRRRFGRRFRPGGGERAGLQEGAGIAGGKNEAQ